MDATEVIQAIPATRMTIRTLSATSKIPIPCVPLNETESMRAAHVTRMDINNSIGCASYRCFRGVFIVPDMIHLLR